MKKFALSIICFCALNVLQAQVDTINPQTNRLIISHLPVGKSTYAVYFTDSITGEYLSAGLWERTVSLSTFHNVPSVHFEWKAYHRDSLYETVSDDCDRKNLAPLYSYTDVTLKGIKAYNWDNGYMYTADTTPNNKANPAKKVALTVPVFNWQWDMETFGMLPFKKVGQQFAIAFLDPNDNKPGYYMHTVVGVEELALNKEAKVKCWVLRVGYNATTYADFWIAQQSHEMLKMREYYKGRYRYKVKLY